VTLFHAKLDKAEQDAVANTCAISTVIGHELTHGFDPKGRLFDAVGCLRDWWTEEDSKNFNARAELFIAPADAFEVLPGLTLNGEQTVSENMADVGAVNFAYQALDTVCPGRIGGVQPPSTSKNDAKRMCKREMKREHHADGFHGISPEELDSG